MDGGREAERRDQRPASLGLLAARLFARRTRWNNYAIGTGEREPESIGAGIFWEPKLVPKVLRGLALLGHVGTLGSRYMFRD